MAHELTKAALGFSWAMSLFGARQLAQFVAAPLRAQAAQPQFYAVTQAAQEQLNDLLWAAFQAGDELQRDAVELLFDTLTLRAFAPAYVKRLASGIAGQARETGSVLSSGWAWQQLKNNYEVYNLVKHVRELLQIPASGAFPLGELIEKAYALGAYPDLWAVEGLGHDYTLAYWQPPQPLRALLTDARADALPDKSLTMMHAGMGLAFAERLLKTVTPYSSPEDLRRVIGAFITLCRENAREGYVGAAYESLGLVARTWHAQVVNLIDRTLQESAPDVAGYFWHGAGRALYFLPLHFVPGSPSAWLAAEREAPHELARLNLIAGLTWATTLVNLRQPEILAALLRLRGDELSSDGAFTNGLMSALMMGYDITPGDVYIREFCRYRPERADAAFAATWRKLITDPCVVALERLYPALRQQGRLGELFHYQAFAIEGVSGM